MTAIEYALDLVERRGSEALRFTFACRCTDYEQPYNGTLHTWNGYLFCEGCPIWRAITEASRYTKQ